MATNPEGRSRPVSHHHTASRERKREFDDFDPGVYQSGNFQSTENCLKVDFLYKHQLLKNTGRESIRVKGA